MAKIFSTSGTGASQVLNEADNNKLKVYDDFEDIDTTALADGEVVSTKENGVGGNVYDYVKDYVEEQIADAQSYSTEETLTGGTWIDGKPIYRRVIYYWLNGAVAPGVTLSNAIYSGDAVPQNIENIIDSYIVSYRSTGEVDVLKSQGENGGVGAFVPNISNRTAYFGNGGYNPTKAYAVFEYTKVTD
jgi:hypothetical protein